jgi:hypothetical protein
MTRELAAISADPNMIRWRQHVAGRTALNGRRARALQERRLRSDQRFAPVVMIARSHQILIVNPAVPAYRTTADQSWRP